MKNKYYSILFEKYLANQCSLEEQELVMQWLKTEEGQQYLESRFDQDITFMDDQTAFLVNYSIQSDEIFDRIQWIKNDAPPPSPIDVPNSAQPPVALQPRWIKIKLAAAVVALLLVAFTTWQIAQNWNVTSYSTAYGQTTTFTLPDGSEVVMNGNSTLRYHNDTPREIWLDGEAFFSVVRTKDLQKFLVHTSDNFTVEVLGTSFNVLKRQEKTKVVLSTGKVQVHIKDITEENPVVMQPGELVEFDAGSTTYTKKVVDPAIYSSWKTDKIIFDETSLGEIVQLLQETHGLTVEVSDPALLQQKFTGSVPNQNVEILLEGLSQILDLKISHQGKRILIQPNP